jgi:hypothetical protein
MSDLKLHMMMSLDGFVAGREQSEENPFGIGGMQLNEWLLPLKAFREMQGERGGEVNASTPIVQGWFKNIGATMMGRNMFGGGPGPWGADPWNGYWGANPPYHHPVRCAHPSWFLGTGARLFDDLDPAKTTLEQVEAVEAPGVTHITYRVPAPSGM